MSRRPGSRLSKGVIKANLKEALRSLLSARQRTVLAIIGIVIGIGSVIGMVSIGEIVRTQAVQQFKDLGTDVVLVALDPASAPTRASLDPALIRAIPGAVPDVLEASPFMVGTVTLSPHGRPVFAQLFGTDERFFTINKLHLRAGRAISDLDGNRFFCVVGAETADAIRTATGEDPVGLAVRLERRVITVVGEIDRVAEGTGIRPDGLNGSVIVPLETAARVFKEAPVTQLMARVRPGVTAAALAAELAAHFARHGKPFGFQVQAAEEIIATMEKQMALYTLLLGAIGSIALIVGGIGVMNVMLISVTERRREIGVRRALGAQETDIRLQFVVESVVLCIVGGLAGVIVGVGTSWIFARAMSYAFVTSSLAVLLGFAVSTLVGVFFGYYPARQASRLDPITALRS